MNQKKDLIRNTLIIGFGKVSTQLISFFLLPLYTAFLSPSDYGAVDLIITYVALFVPAITIQLEMASFRFLVDARKNEADKKRIISNVMQIVTVILVVCILAFLILNSLLRIQFAALILLNIGVTIFSNLFLQFARGMGDNKNFATASIATGLTTLIATIILIVVLHMGAEGMLLSIALANLVGAIYLFFSLKLYNYIGLKEYDRVLRKRLIAYSFPLVPNGVSWWVINVSDRTIISIIIGVAANGIYAVANKYAAIFTSIFGIFSMSWTESASVHIDDKDRDKFFSDTSNASVKLFGSLGIALIAFIPLVFTMLVNDQYEESYLYIPILVVAAFFNGIVGLYSAIYVAKKLTKQVAATSITAAAINIVLNIVFIKFLGLWAAAISTAVAYAAMSIYRHYDIKKHVLITYEKNIFIKMAILYAVVMSLYYFNNVVGNVINVIFVAVVVVLLNKSVVKIVKNKVFGLAGHKPKKLTREQEVYEDSI